MEKRVRGKEILEALFLTCRCKYPLKIEVNMGGLAERTWRETRKLLRKIMFQHCQISVCVLKIARMKNEILD